jgi:hypothetical protein
MREGFNGLGLVFILGITSLGSPSALAQSATPVQPGDFEPEGTASGPPPAPGWAAGSYLPILAYAYSARAEPAKALGVQAYGIGLAASRQDAVLGGGLTVWGAPMAQLTLIADVQRNVWRDYSPSLAAIVHLLGNGEGWSLGGLGRFKVDGFASSPSKGELESEIELGALVSWSGRRWHWDMNAIAGTGLGDEAEIDTEGRLRVEYELGSSAHLGVDGQARARVAGPRVLPNGRTWDVAGGAQLLLGSASWYGAITAGPTTAGVTTKSVGFSAIVSFGGVEWR